MENTKTVVEMVKAFEEMTIAEKFRHIALKVNDTEMASFLSERADMQDKANSKGKGQGKVNPNSAKLKEAVLQVLTDNEGTRFMAEAVFEELETQGYEDKHTAGLTVARVRAQLSALVKDEAINKFNADTKKGSQFPRVSYCFGEYVEVAEIQKEG